jgi:hypothetical protein
MIKAIKLPELHESADKNWGNELQEVAVHGTLQEAGLTEKARQELQTKLKSGDILDSHLVDELITQNRPLLPADVTHQDAEFRRNGADGVVDIDFDSWACPDADQDSPH